MGIIKDEDCVQTEAGTYVCWNDAEQCFYEINVQKKAAGDLPNEVLGSLVKLMSKQRTKKAGPEVV